MLLLQNQNLMFVSVWTPPPPPDTKKYERYGGTIRTAYETHLMFRPPKKIIWKSAK